jgi:hypothetical protein
VISPQLGHLLLPSGSLANPADCNPFWMRDSIRLKPFQTKKIKIANSEAIKNSQLIEPLRVKRVVPPQYRRSSETILRNLAATLCSPGKSFKAWLRILNCVHDRPPEAMLLRENGKRPGRAGEHRLFESRSSRPLVRRLYHKSFRFEENSHHDRGYPGASDE